MRRRPGYRACGLLSALDRRGPNDEHQPQNTPSQEGRQLLETLRQSVAKTLEKKRRLGQYAVTWQNGKPVVTGEDAPAPTRMPTRAALGDEHETHQRSRLRDRHRGGLAGRRLHAGRRQGLRPRAGDLPGRGAGLHPRHPGQGVGEAGGPARRADRRAGAGIAVQVAGHPRHAGHAAPRLQVLRQDAADRLFPPGPRPEPGAGGTLPGQSAGADPPIALQPEDRKSRWTWCCRSTAFRW